MLHVFHGDAMFDDVMHWFLARTSDRRQYERRAGEFQVHWLPDPAVEGNLRPGIGTELSPNGIVFLIPDIVSVSEFDLNLHVRDRVIATRVKRVRGDRVERERTSWNRYMCEFVEVAADDWDEIVRFVNATAEPVRRRLQNQAMGPHVDDAYRLLPSALQAQIVDLLVSQQKLERPSDGTNPLLKLFYGGAVQRSGGHAVHRFNAHSRIVKSNRMMAYDTRLLIGEDGRIIPAATPES